MAGLNYTPNPLKRRIAEGEGPMLDFKKTISSAQKIAKTLVAFANSRGGSILIGVHDNGNITGAEVDEEAYMIESAANFFSDPVVEYSTIVHPYNQLQVLEIVIPESQNKPHSAKNEDGKWWVYIRVNDRVEQASKVTVDVLRRQYSEETTSFEFTSKEAALLTYLSENDRITLKDFCKMLNLSRRRAIRILVNLVSAGVIREQHSENFVYYTLA